MNQEKLTVGVIGCGLAGIAMSSKLQREGIPFEVFEKAPTLGGSWQDPYYNQGLQIPVATMQFYDKPFRIDEKPQPMTFLKAPEYLKYLQEYSQERGFLDKVIFNTQVLQVAFDDQKQSWTVMYQTQGEPPQQKTFKFVIDCRGIFNEKVLPHRELFSNFPGPYLHSADVKEISQFKDKHVVVIGGGKSAYDIVENLMENCTRVTMVIREPRWPTPMEFNIFKYTLFCEGLVDYYQPNALQRWLREHPRLRRFYEACLEQKVDKALNLSRLGIRPKTPLFKDWHMTTRIMKSDFYHKASMGLAHFQVAEIQEVLGNHLVLSNGETIPADAVISATGYKKNFRIFEERFQSLLQEEVKNAGDLFLFRDMLHPQVPNYIFMGQIVADAGPAWGMQAMWISFFLKKQLALTREDLSIEGMEKDRQKRMEHCLKEYPGIKASSKYRAFIESAYFELLALDMGFDFRSTFAQSFFRYKSIVHLTKYSQIFNSTVEESVEVRKKQQYFGEKSTNLAEELVSNSGCPIEFYWKAY